MRPLRIYLQKMSGGTSLPAHASFFHIFLAGVGAGLAIAIGVYLEEALHFNILMAPLGASCFLAFAIPDSPLAQPRNIVLGHMISSCAALFVLQFFGYGALQIALAVALAVMAMLATRTSHAPAAATPLVIFALQPTWDYLVAPVLPGALVVALTALIFNNLRPSVRYPQYW